MADHIEPPRLNLVRFDSAAADELALRCREAIATLDEVVDHLRRVHPTVVEVWRGQHRDEFDARCDRLHRHVGLVREDLARLLGTLAGEAAAVAAENRRRIRVHEARLAAWREAA